MKSKAGLKIINQLTEGRFLFFALSSLAPALIAIIFAVVMAFKYDHLLLFSALIGTPVLASLPFYYRGIYQKKKTVNAEMDSTSVQPNPIWSARESDIYQSSQQQIQAILQQQPAWSDMDTFATQILEDVAKQFEKKPLDFTLPEGLCLFEEVSRRYRHILNENLPAAEHVKISHIQTGYRLYDEYGETASKVIQAGIYANQLKNLYLNPMKAAIDFTRQQAATSMQQDLIQHLDHTTKKLLLEEVASVAIDLYSGRFHFDTSELETPKSLERDMKQAAIPAAPVRIVLIGQINAGKSSLIHALSGGKLTHIDALPSLPMTQVYQSKIEESSIHWVDLQGICGDEKQQDALFNEMIEADLLIWVLKGTQSARALDRHLKEKFDAYFEDAQHISRKKPSIIFVMTYIDQLKPVDDWSLPLNLSSPLSAKEKTIVDALAYNKNLLGLEQIFPVCLCETKQHVGIEDLNDQLTQHLDAALHVQVNRQQHEAISRKKSISHQLKKKLFRKPKKS